MIDFKYIPKIDFQALNKRSENMNKKVLKRVGAYISGTAKRKIKYRKKASSKSQPGQAPYTHNGRKRPKALKNSIVFSADDNSVLIGAAKTWIGKIASLHEHGTSQRLSLPPKDLLRDAEIGKGGPVSSRKYKGKVIKGVEYYDPYDGSPVVWVKIKSTTMMKHSQRLIMRLRKAYAKSKVVKYPKRPFILPALDDNKKRIPEFWKNAL